MLNRRSRFSFLSIVGLCLPFRACFEGAPGAAGAAGAGSAGAGSGGNGGGSQTFTPPAGFVLVKESDHRGQSERLTGFEKGLGDLGIKGLDELKPMADLFKPENRTRVQQMMGLLSPAAQERVEDKAKEGNLSREEVTKLIAAETAKAQAAANKESAFKAHGEAASPKKVREWIKGQAAEMLGDGVNEDTVAAFVAEAYGRIHMAREDALESKDPAKIAAFMYPEGHPLHGEALSPFGPENTKDVFEALKTSASKRTGAIIGSIGRAAAKAPERSTPAGQRTATQPGEKQGKPEFKDVVSKLRAEADKVTA